MLVGATTKNGPKADFSQYSPLVQIHASGKSLWEVRDPARGNGVIATDNRDEAGTSFGKTGQN